MVKNMESLSNTYAILDFLKNKKFDELFEYINKNNIDPRVDDDIIPDYAAIWVDDEDLLPLFKRFKAIGGNPAGHRSIINNTSRYGKVKSLEYLIEEGALKRDDTEVVYAINNAMMDGRLNSIKVLIKYIDVTKYKLLDESNPSIINRVIDYPNIEILDYLFKKNIIQPYLFSKEFVARLENLKGSNDEEKKQIHDYKNYIITKVLINVENKDFNKYLLEQEEYKPGDIFTIFKTIEYNVLNKELGVNKVKTKNIKL